MREDGADSHNLLIMRKKATPTPFEKERPGGMLLLLACLALLLHLLVYRLIERPAQPALPNTHPRPFKLEISMISGSDADNAKSVTTPPNNSQDKTPPKEAPKKVNEKKSPEKKLTEENVALEQLLKSEPHKTVTQSVKAQREARSVQTVAATMLSHPKKPNAIDNFPESDPLNPSPEYPDMAIFLGYQGTAFIRINVTAKGVSSGVQVLKSSGHKILDDAAAKALRQWRFTGTNQNDSVIIAVNFMIRNY